MLTNYIPIYQIALNLEGLRAFARIYTGGALSRTEISPHDKKHLEDLLTAIQRDCPGYGLTHTSELATGVKSRPLPETYAEIFQVLNHLNDSLTNELRKEAIFCIPPERKDYFERDDLFGAKVANAFPSCARDIKKAGSCYALGQEDACVHHLMLVLERGLNALALKVDVPYERTNWQPIIGQIKSKIEKGTLPRGAERDFYLETNAQFGFLKDAYRNHSEHARDDHYDMPKALHILNHVRDFMQALEKGGLSE